MKMSAGTVMIDSTGRVLLRLPSGGFGGYSWTFSKGRIDAGESVEDAAVRETLEETGYECTLGQQIGTFEGTSGLTVFFLAVPGQKVAEPHYETEAVQWFYPEEARRAIMTTPNDKGRKRDLAVLDAAISAAGSGQEV